MSVLQQLDELKEKVLNELGAIGGARELEAWRIRYLGKKSQLNEILRGLSSLPFDVRIAVGAAAYRL